ncbi:MAG: HEAT repeat domain-containing protein [Planctomycetes bacterium]|nr:HEAT repeat domain-containing protein [Planctomycetota bacterium]
MRVFLLNSAALFTLIATSGCHRSPSAPAPPEMVASSETEPMEIGVEEPAPPAVVSSTVVATTDAPPPDASDGGVDDEATVATAAVSATEEEIQSLRGMLSGGDASQRRDAAAALGVLHHAASTATGELTSSLQDEDGEVRAAAAEALGKIGDRNPNIVASLLELIDHEQNDAVLHAAMAALRRLGVPRDADPAPLLRALNSDEESVRQEAAWLLGELTPQDGKLDLVAAALIDALSDESRGVREIAYGSLGQLGRGRPQITLALLPLLESEDADYRYRAAYALSLIGPDARPAVPSLLELIRREQDEETRTEAIRALREIDAQAAKGLSTPPDES